MFKKTTICPTTKKDVAVIEEQKGICEGIRDGRILKNSCASCQAYKRYVEQTVK
jgi:hypothetical protein